MRYDYYYLGCIFMSTINYFNQKSTGDIPEIFALGIISTEAYEFAGSFSPDGKEFFFTRRPTYEGSENRIFSCSFQDGKWTEPKLAPFALDIFEFLPYVAPKGDILFFSSYRTKPQETTRNGEIWYSLKTEVGWSEAKYLDASFNKRFTMYITSTIDGTLYFTAKDDQKRGIFKSELKNNIYQEPEYLPMEINSISPAHPFIAPDESYLIMDTQLKGMGMPELYISFRRSDGGWTEALNMGKTINATSTEYGPSVSPDGKYLFFHRRVGTKGDIYWVSSKIIDKLRKQII